jgi:hypothetical protein
VSAERQYREKLGPPQLGVDAVPHAAAGTLCAMSWLVQHVPLSTATLAAIFGRGLQERVWRDLADKGPATVHDLTARIGEDHERVRNALYRLASLEAVRCHMRVPSPIGGSLPRVVWAACDRDGLVVGARRQSGMGALAGAGFARAGTCTATGGLR